MITRWNRRIGFACVVALLSAAAPGQGDAPQEQPEAPQASEPDRAALRARLTRVLEHLEQTAGSIRSAIETLDTGGSTADAIEELGGPTVVRRFSETWERWNRPADPREDARDQPGREDHDSPREIDAEHVRAFLEEHAPGVAARLDQVREGSPRRAEALVSRLKPRVAEILAARAHDPELAEILTREFTVGMALLDAAGESARARRAGDEAKLEEIRPRLAELAAEQVDLRLRRREHELATLAERVAALSEELEQQRQDRERLVNQLIDRASEGWREKDDEDRRRRRRGGGRD